jgi:amino acid efflux transporter
LLAVTGAFTLVYVVGTAAALRLLPCGSAAWRCAAVSFVATLGLLALTGRHLLVSLGIAAGALVWTTLAQRRDAARSLVTLSGPAPGSVAGPEPLPAAGCPAEQTP